MEYKPTILYRDDFLNLAERRLNEAKCLLDADHPDGAYYLAGYSVECALKAVIASKMKANQFPPDRKKIETYYQHNLSGLLNASGLSGNLDIASTDLRVKENWAIVKDWNSESRYCRIYSIHAKELVEAVGNPESGILEWVRKHL